jgi:hypothetical protein
MLLDLVLISNFLTLFSIQKLQQWFHHVTLEWHKLFGGALDREIVIPLPQKKKKKKKKLFNQQERKTLLALNEWMNKI